MSDRLPVMECYSTFQGEGFFTGSPAWFLRLQGCDVGCVWCDVKDSWEMDVSKNKPISELVEIFGEEAIEKIVVTGGEPTLYDLRPLCHALHEKDYQLHLETAGTNTIMGDFDWIVLSPKKFKPCLEENFQKADELKVVIYHPSDLDWAKELAEKTRSETKLYLQPEWSKSENMIPVILEFCKYHPQWSLSLQTHKYVGMP